MADVFTAGVCHGISVTLDQLKYSKSRGGVVEKNAITILSITLTVIVLCVKNVTVGGILSLRVLLCSIIIHGC